MTLSNSIELYDNTSSTLDVIYNGSIAVVKGFEEISDTITNMPDLNMSWDNMDIDSRFDQLNKAITDSVDEIYQAQEKISSEAYDMSILPKNAIYDIANVSDRVMELYNKVRELANIDVSGNKEDVAAINSQLEKSKSILDNINRVQDRINSAMTNSDVSAMSAGYHQLNSLAEELENTVRRTVEMTVKTEPEKVFRVKFDVDEIPVFTTSGIERYEQELSSANALMNEIVDTQNQINSTNVNIISISAFNDLENINSRMLAIQQKIQEIGENPLNVGSEEANAGLENIRSQLNQALKVQNELNAAIADMDADKANASYQQLNRIISSTERYIRDNTTAQGQFNKKVSEGENAIQGFLGKITKLGTAYLSIRTIMSGVSKAVNLSDEITQTSARLDMLIDNFGEAEKTSDELFSQVYAAAQDARGSITDMADVVARFGNNAKDAFGSSDEVVAFATLVQKQMTIAGATTSEASNAMLQLSQALGSGVLRGDELNSIFENAPNLIQNIADYLEKPIGEIRDMASEGELTADVVKNAIFAASDEINEKFESMPMTWGQMWTKFTNTATMAFENVLTKINEIANSQAVQSFVNIASNALTKFADAAVNVIDGVSAVINMVVSNPAIQTFGAVFAKAFSIIGSAVSKVFQLVKAFADFITRYEDILQYAIYGLAAAFLVLNANVVLTLWSTIKDTAAKIANAVANAAETAAIIALTIAQEGFNAALAACPVTWIIVAIIAIIALIFMVCQAIAKSSDTANSAFGVICGAINVVIAFFKNLGLTAANILLGIWNAIKAVAANIKTAFSNAINFVEGTFYDLLSVATNVISKIAEKLNKLPFVNIDTEGLINKADEYAAKAAEKYKNIDTGFENISEAFNKGWSTFDTFQEGWISDAYTAGAAWGDNISSTVSSKLNELKETLTGATEIGESALNGIDTSAAETAENTKETADAIKNSEDILEMIKDSVSKERIASYTTKQINVDMSGMSNSIASSMSIADVVKRLEKEIANAAAAAVEGV